MVEFCYLDEEWWWEWFRYEWERRWTCFIPLHSVVEILKVGAADLADFFELLSDVVVFEGGRPSRRYGGRSFDGGGCGVRLEPLRSRRRIVWVWAGCL